LACHSEGSIWNLIMIEKDVKKEKIKLKENEHDNFPKGAVKTSHKFCTYKKFRSNEEMFKLTDEEILPGPIITPHIESLGSKCCRGAYNLSKKALINIFKVHGEGIEVYIGSQEEHTVDALTLDNRLVEVVVPEDPEFGWDMHDRENGFPCIALLPNGKCKYQEEGQEDFESEKPKVCKMFPSLPSVLKNIPTCSN